MLLQFYSSFCVCVLLVVFIVWSTVLASYSWYCLWCGLLFIAWAIVWASFSSGFVYGFGFGFIVLSCSFIVLSMVLALCSLFCLVFPIGILWFCVCLCVIVRV